MAAAEPAAAARRLSMAPTATAAVPAGAAPVVPAFVPPAQVYEDDEDEVEDVMRPKPAQQMGTSGPSLGVIFGVALVVITLSAVVTFYAIGNDKTTTLANLPSSTSTPGVYVVVTGSSSNATSAPDTSAVPGLEPADGDAEQEVWTIAPEEGGD